MSDEPVVQDKPSDGAPEPTENGAPAPEPKPDKADERFMLEFKSRDEAERGYKELQGAFTKAAQERAALNAKLEVLERMAKPNYENKTSEDQKARDQAIVEKLESGGSQAILQVLREGLMDVVDMTTREREALKREIMDMIETRDPEYTKEKEAIEGLMTEYGLSDRQKAIRLHRELTAAKQPKQPDRPKPPGRIASTRVIDEDEIEPVALSEHANSFIDATSDLGFDKKTQDAMRLKLGRILAKRKG